MRFVLFISLVLCGTVGAAQNLVPNGSFEEYTQCPDFWNQMERATGWSRYRESPDYFNACDTSGYVGVPTNVLGYQPAADGDAYVGVALWGDFLSNIREHLGAQLSQALIPGIPVYISFKVSPASNGVGGNQRWTCAGMGLRFVMAPYEANGLDPLPNSAAVYMNFAPLDTSAWYTVSGVYVPDSAYQYVVLGNFFDDSLTVPVLLNPDGDYPGVYAYVDDVCVSYEPGECDSSSGLVPINRLQSPSVFPDPFRDECHVAFTGPSSSQIVLELTDPLGRSVKQGILRAGERSLAITAGDLPSGAYILRAQFPAGAFRPVVLLHVSP